jgi:hypothetical protein
MPENFTRFGYPTLKGLTYALRGVAKTLQEDEVEDVTVEVCDGGWRLHAGNLPDDYAPTGPVSYAFCWWNSDVQELARRLIEGLILDQAAYGAEAEAEEESR